MTGRITDGSPGFFAVLGFMGVAMIVASMWLLTAYPPNEMAPRKPNDACRDGIVQQFDGKDWHPVVIDRPSRHYDGKKWVSDYPKGYQRTIPCKEPLK